MEPSPNLSGNLSYQIKSDTSHNKCLVKARRCLLFINQAVIYIQQGHSRWQTQRIMYWGEQLKYHFE